jgi:chromatin remodeling complex protein RSC6
MNLNTDNEANIDNIIIEKDDIKYPVNVVKLINNVKLLKTKLINHKNDLDKIISTEVKNIDKLLEKIIEKNVKNIKQKKERKPSGFALPTKVSDDLCLFMGVNNNTLISRTQATKFIMNYIKVNNLQNPDNKQFILPDDKMKSFLGPEIDNVDLTHFNIQKYINRHFQK